MENNKLQIKFIKTNKLSVTPTKAYSSDVGYDLTVFEVYKKISDKTTIYNTGIIVIPPDGYYTKIVPRSSISKTGYILSNNVGIIDSTYTGNLLIALTKVDDSMPDLKCPFTRCQLILEKCIYSEMIEVSEIPKTKRSNGGFGSTDK
jgi:dUTP pyrophosphatase